MGDTLSADTSSINNNLINVEHLALIQLIENPNQAIPKGGQQCDVGENKHWKIKDFITGYIQRTFESNNLKKRSLKCESPKGSTYICVFKFSGEDQVKDSADKDTILGWDRELEFEYDLDKGIIWSSIKCIDTP